MNRLMDRHPPQLQQIAERRFSDELTGLKLKRQDAPFQISVGGVGKRHARQRLDGGLATLGWNNVA